VAPRVYIETTIPSYYYDTREKNAIKCRWTRFWWDELRQNFELVTSAAVIAELRAGNHPAKNEKLALVLEIQLLPPAEEVERAIEAYIREFVMPKEPVADAAHLAFASFYRCDFLLT
jgi:hypothetical protein